MTPHTPTLPFPAALARGLAAPGVPCVVHMSEQATSAGELVGWHWKAGALRVHVRFAARVGVWSFAADRVAVADDDGRDRGRGVVAATGARFRLTRIVECAQDSHQAVEPGRERVNDDSTHTGFRQPSRVTL